MFLETIGDESVLLYARVSAVLLYVFPDSNSEDKFSNLSFSYLFINYDRAYLGSITQREARTNAVSFSLSTDFDSIIAPDVTAAFNERLPESSSLHILPTRAGDRNQRETERMVVTVEGA